jgi:hypothetical protein
MWWDRGVSLERRTEGGSICLAHHLVSLCMELFRAAAERAPLCFCCFIAPYGPQPDCVRLRKCAWLSSMHDSIERCSTRASQSSSHAACFEASAAQRCVLDWFIYCRASSQTSSPA